MDLGALWRKLVLGDKYADVIKGVNVKQLQNTPNGMVTQKQADANPYIEQGQIINPRPVAGTVQQPQQIQQNGGGGGPISQAAAVPAGPPEPTAAQLNPLFASLDSLGTIHTNKNNQTNAEYATAIAGYDEADATDKTNHQTGVTGNEKSYTANNQKALLNAANASTGLRGVLASLGGLAGSGKDIVAKLVGLAANADTGASRENFEANATGLTTAWSEAERKQRQRRTEAESTRQNGIKNNEASILSTKQGILKQLADAYGSTHAKGLQYANEAAALAAPIAATTVASVAPYAKADSAYSPAAVKEYLAGTQNLTVDTSGGGVGSVPINSAAYVPSGKKKDELAGVA